MLDGLVLVGGVYLLVLAIALLAKRLQTTWLLSTLALVLALALGLAMKFPFMGS